MKIQKIITSKTGLAVMVMAAVASTGLYLLSSSRAAETLPSITAQGSFTERPCTRTYALTGMQVGNTGDPNANGNRMRSVLAAAQSGDCITVSAGIYKLAGNIEFNIPNITLKGMGVNREAVWFEHTTETQAIFMVKAGGVHFYNFTHRVFGSARSSLGQSGEGNIWVQGGHSGFRMQDVLAWGSRDAAIFLYGVHNFEFNRVESRDSKSDAFHISNGSSYGKWYDSVSRNSGDDGLGFVGYGGEGPGTPHHHTVVRHHVAGQTWGRGIGIIHVNNISFYGPTLIEDSAGAGVIMARETLYGSGSVRAIRFYGELRLRRSNHHENIRYHGGIMIHNDSTSAAIEDVLIEGPVRFVDTGINNTYGAGQHVKAHGVGKIQAEIRNASFYGTGPSTKLVTGLATGSLLTTPGWSNATGYSGAEPAFTFTPEIVTPTPTPTVTNTLSITAPIANQSVSNPISFSGSHTNMKNVEIYRSGVKVASATVGATNWTATVNEIDLPPGTYTYDVKAWDALAGQPFTITETRSVTVQVISPPAVVLSITTPSANQIVGNPITFSGTHTNMKNVEIYRSGIKVASAVVGASSWNASVGTAGLAVGQYTFEVKAWDSLPGQPFTKTDTRTVTVQIPTAAVVIPGDANADGRVNALDMSIIIARDGQAYPSADFNGDNIVGAADLAIALSRWTW